MRIVDNGWRMPFFGKQRNMLDLGSDQKGLFAENPYIKQKKFGDVDPKIATSQKAPGILLTKILCDVIL